MLRLCVLLFVSLVVLTSGCAVAGSTEHSRFEARHLHALDLTPDGKRLLVVHAPTATLSVFAVSAAPGALPVLQAEIPVGLEPVTVRARTNTEAWVINELSDSVSIVDLTRGVIVQTLAADDEPADIVFAAGQAYVSCARNNLIRVFDAATREARASISLEGVFPRALAASADGRKVYAAFLLSGNRTTTLPADLAPAPPAPENPALPPAPQTGLLVASSDPRIAYHVQDHDVAEIDTTTGRVTRYLEDIGTNLYDLALSPGGELWVANTQSLNLIRFEPKLRGHFQDSRLSRVDLISGHSQAFDLNAGLDYSTLPNPAAQQTALAQPMAVLWHSDEKSLWVAAHGSDQVAQVASDGAILRRVNLRTGVPAGATGTAQMRGPRSLALDAEAERLFVFNKLSDTVSVIGTGQGDVQGEIAVASHDPTPERLRLGRKFFSDARLAGNGSASCAACHPDADQDGIAWDLGDPTAEMVFTTGTNIGKPQPQTRALHPMKGPMVTQTLRGLAGTGELHWRADRKDIQGFNVSFDKLQGGARLPAAEMDLVAEYLQSLRHYPNPNRTLEDGVPALFHGGSPEQGRALFAKAKSNCSECHALPFTTNNNIDSHKEVGSRQPLKTPSLRTVYQRVFFDGQAGHRSRSGFGLGHDGTGFQLPIAHPYVLESLSEEQEFTDLAAFVLCVETGTPPAVGHSITIGKAQPARAVLEQLTTLEQQAAKGAIDLIVRGLWQGASASFLYIPGSDRYRSQEQPAAEQTRGDLLAGLQAEDAVTFLGTLPGQGSIYLHRVPLGLTFATSP